MTSVDDNRGTRADRSRKLKILLTAVVLLALCGCLDNTARDHDACVLKAIEIYKPELVEVHDPSGRYVWRCMLAAGYLLDNSIKPCTAYGGPNPSKIQLVAMVPGCWKPKSSWGWR